PVLLTEAGVFARYDAMGVLDRLASAARRGGRGGGTLRAGPGTDRGWHVEAELPRARSESGVHSRPRG
ncbi:hypothetical protein ABZ931_27505, partial [Streptomyces neyagawaensis]